ncbi:hypothetical protein [Streptomyces sp. NPDC050287]|uniref:hypothetical protein n=1 Tax=Streptomyces sp. NPDC050287 TaxID=3365608 RepID=UPI0037B0B52D
MSRSPNTQRSRLEWWNAPKYRATTQRFDYSLEPAVLRALLGAAVDTFVGGVDIDERLLAGSGQQRGMRGQRGQELAVHGVELECVTVRDRA